MAVLRNGSKCSHTSCMLRFFTVSRLALNPNLFFEIGSKSYMSNFEILIIMFSCHVIKNLSRPNRLAFQAAHLFSLQETLLYPNLRPYRQPRYDVPFLAKPQHQQ